MASELNKPKENQHVDSKQVISNAFRTHLAYEQRKYYQYTVLPLCEGPNTCQVERISVLKLNATYIVPNKIKYYSHLETLVPISLSMYLNHIRQTDVRFFSI